MMVGSAARTTAARGAPTCGLWLLLLLTVVDPVGGLAPPAAVVAARVRSFSALVGAGLLPSSASSKKWCSATQARSRLLCGSTTTTAPTNDEDQNEARQQRQYDRDLFVTAAIPPVVAFLTYGTISHGLSYLFDSMGFSGSNVDGNMFATNLLRPTLNGVVVPATGIGLGTLFATTVNVLWNRQLKLRSTINMEVCELRLLRRALFGCFGTAQHCRRRAVALDLLLTYVQTLQAECDADCMSRLERVQNNGGISQNELDELAEMLHGVDGAAASRQSSVTTAAGLLVSLNGHRSERVATTLSVFPQIHWLVLNILYFCIVLSFLIDSNQEVNQYLNSIQVLFSIIASVGSGAAMLLKDLEDPFHGSFCVSLAAKQLTALEELLRADLAEASNEQVGAPTALVSLDRSLSRPNYNTRNTVYFHLLTGPLAYNIRILGDLCAWAARRITRNWKAWSRRWSSRRSSSRAKDSAQGAVGGLG